MNIKTPANPADDASPYAVLYITCKMCNCRIETDRMSLDGLIAWKSGELIQDALSELGPEDRELLISRICSTCFDDLFKKI